MHKILLLRIIDCLSFAFQKFLCDNVSREAFLESNGIKIIENQIDLVYMRV